MVIVSPSRQGAAEVRVDSSIDRPHAKLGKLMGRIAVLSEEAIAQVARRIDVGCIVDVPVRIQVRPTNFVLAAVSFHESVLCCIAEQAGTGLYLR